MSSVSAHFLVGSTNGFVLVTNYGFDSASVAGNKLNVVKSSLNPGLGYLSGVFQQGATTNKYSDLGVPAGARVTGIKFLGASVIYTLGSTAVGNVQIYTNEADLGFYNITSIGESDIIPLDLTADNYVRFLVELSGHAEFSEFEDYGYFEIQFSHMDVEIFYEVSVDISGNVVSSISFDGTLSQEKRLSGNVASSIPYGGTLSQEKRLAGSVASSIAYDGTLSHLGVGNLRGDIVSSISYAGTLSLEKQLSGDVPLEIAFDGFLTNNSSNNKQLSGNVRSSVVYAGTMTWVGLHPPTPGFNLNTNLAGEITAIERLIITDTSNDADSYQYKVNGVIRANIATPDLTRWIGLTDGVPDEITQIVTNEDGPRELTKTVLVVPVIIENGLDLIKVLNNIPVGVSLRGKVRAVGNEGFASQWSNTDDATST